MIVGHLDYETRSTVDLKKTGTYVYSEDPSTDIWCAAYAVDDQPVKLWTPDGDEDDIHHFMRHCDVLVAHNANFERTITAGVAHPRYGYHEPRVDQWRCTMAMAMAMSLPGSLDNCAAALGLDTRKDMEGHSTMMRMARPRRPRKGENPDGIFWFDDEDRKQKLYSYCRNDVEVERAIEKRLLQLRPSELQLWHLDQQINDRGIYVDVELCNAALRIVDKAAKWLNEEIRELTGGQVSATTNVAQIITWLHGLGVHTDSLDKANIEQLLLMDMPDDARRVIEIRREAAKAAVKKIDAMLAGRNSDGRVRGLLQFNAASTGRWGGRRVQPQNFVRPTLPDIDTAIADVMEGSAERLQLLYGNPLAVVSDCLRGMLTAAPGKELMAADFSGIESRVLAWLAGEEWKLQAFRDYDAGQGHDNYVMAYSRSFGVRPEDVTKAQRQVGKVEELAFGFQGGVGALQKMAVIYGLTVDDSEADEWKVAWREAHPQIVQFWHDLDAAAQRAINNPGTVQALDKVAFRMAGSFLLLRLPSGRTLVYPYPRIGEKAVPWGGTRPTVIYKGVDSYTRQWGDQYAYGGLWAENVTQAVARDVMAEAMVRVEAAGYPVVLSVHDEVVCEVEKGSRSVSEFEKIMVALPSWATGLPVAAEAWAARRYRK